ncbi:hypothetical protein F8566_04295 [Actinomadura rudentiformis]|uniref:DUF8094 domain-containing protein n=2 Tax=Actinomadura rudentiformis TaxID=359158 RepID=A0A6H9YZ76_9ACTN|nr:hypothetical protein F8566_04295 [Actinomadura rudentiformis]
MLAPLVLPPLLLSSACGQSSSNAQSDAGPALSKTEAAQVLELYKVTADRASRRLDAKSLAAVETGPQLAMDTATFKLHRAAEHRVAGRGAGNASFGKPTFYIPRINGHPRWFAADVTAGTGKDTLRHAFVFTQAKPSDPWLLAADPHPSGAALTKIALDEEGYATTVRPSERELALQPARLPATHAALLSGGPKAPGAAGLAPGPQTTQAYDGLRRTQDRLMPGGITLSSHFTPEPGPVYALRTTDGGALVWYVVRQNEAYSSSKQGKLAVTGDLVGLAPPSAVKTHLDTVVLVQYLAAVPREGKARVTGMYRKAISAAGS